MGRNFNYDIIAIINLGIGFKPFEHFQEGFAH